MLKICYTINFSLESGYRNSGLTIGKAGKLVLAVRSTHGLEVPLTDHLGRLLVDQNYIEFVAGEANAKLLENETRIKLYETKCSTLFRKLITAENVSSLGTVKNEEKEAQVCNQEDV